MQKISFPNSIENLVYIYGAGHFGVLTALNFEQNGISIKGFIDSSKELQGKQRLGIPVVSIEEALKARNQPESTLTHIVIAVANFNPVREKLIAAGLKENADFSVSKLINADGNYSAISYYANPHRNFPTPPPPSSIPPELLKDFTINGQIPVLYWYFDERNDNRIRNTAETYKKVFEQLNSKTFQYYGSDINSFYAAFEKYSLKDKTVLIWGLAGCNCEAMALWQGASKVYVIDYNKPICDFPNAPEKIVVMNHEELSKSGIKTDVAISFSSFEHDGLGRYGDPLNPNGDLEAMKTARNYLNEGGFMMLGVPQGPDCLVWNAHRIYGEKRLPLLLNGWKIESIFEQESPKEKSLGDYDCQPLMVLR